MIIDAFMYFNEQDVAEIRMNELKDVVDRFVVIRGNLTFSGKPNPHEFKIPPGFENKVDVVRVNLITHYAQSAWERERRTRDALLTYLRQNFLISDSIIFTDVDEIPSAESARIACEIGSPISLNLDHYNYNFRYLKPHWECGIISQLGYIHDAEIRNHRSGSYNVGGWHLSYFGNAKHIQQKLQAYSHTEFDIPKYTDLDVLQNRIDNNIDIIDRPPVEIERRFRLPEFVLDNEERFKDYL